MKNKLVLIVVLVLITVLPASAQPNDIIKYFNKYWSPTTKDSAEFYAVFTPRDKVYDCTSYMLQTNKLHAISVQADTNFTQSIGLSRTYYASGQLKDSSFHHPKTGKVEFTYYYYPSGKPWAIYQYNASSNKEEITGLDEQGGKIKNFIYQREAAFKNDQAGWVRYLSGNLKSNTPVKKGAPKGTYMVIIRFMVAPDGRLTNVEAETNHGYGMEEEGIRVIQRSPKWQPAVHLNTAITAYRRQPLTFVVQEK